MSEQTVPIKYRVLIGDPRDSSSHAADFTFGAHAPISLCKDVSLNKPDDYTDAVGKFLTKLARLYEGMILASYPWTCIICAKPAGGIVSCSVPCLSPAENRDLRVTDFMVPVCIAGGLCDGQANQVLRTSMRASNPDPTNARDELTSCQSCGKTSGLKLCNGCNSCKYCSKECQAKDWGGHKRHCKQIRLEREKAEADSAAAQESLGKITLGEENDSAA